MKIKRPRAIVVKEPRGLKRAHAAQLAKQRESKRHAQLLRGKVLVNSARLGRNSSYGIPGFVQRGYYVDMPFRCKDCGVNEVWTDTQQKWWYEIAHGDLWTVAVRCRACRRTERARKSKARGIHLAGLARKAQREL